MKSLSAYLDSRETPMPVTTGYVFAILTVALATLVRWLLDPVLHEHFPYELYLVAVVVVAWQTWIGPSVAALFLGAGAATIVFLLPRGQWAPTAPDQLVGLCAYLLVGAAVVLASERFRRAHIRAELRGDTLRVTLASIAEGVITTDTQRRITFCNAMAEALTGWALEEALGKPVDSVFRIRQDTGSPIDDSATKAISKSGMIAFDNMTLVSRDGTVRPIEHSIAPICGSQGELGAVFVFRDVSSRRKSEEALKSAALEQHRQKQFLRRLIDNSPVAIAIVQGVELRYVMVNPAYQAIAGSPESIVGKTHEEVFPRAAEFGSLQRLRHVLTTGEPWKIRDFEIPLRNRRRTWWDGEVLPLTGESGQVDSALILSWDITERKLSERALHESEEKFRTLADNVSQFAWMADPDGWIFWYNRRWFEYTGTTLGEMEGWGWQSVHHPDHVDRVVKRIRHCFETGTFWEDTFPLRGKDGKYRWFLSRAVPIRDRDGKVVRWFGTNTDIDDQRKAEEALRYSEAREKAARKEAERAGRFKDEFLATLSHELRNPLNAVLGWTRVLQKAVQDQPQVLEGLDIIERNAKAQAQLVSDLLDMNRIAAGKMRLNIEEIDLARVVQEAVETMRHAIDAKGLHLETSLPSESLILRADPDRMRQVVWNLLSNAVKFTPEEGRISIVVKKEAAQAILTVADTGQGISAEYLPRIFQKFQQGDPAEVRKHGGLGLGLALVKQFVEMHGGEVVAECPGEGGGSTFRVKIPVYRGASPAPGAGSSEPAATPQREDDFPDLANLKVLVVDNDPDSCVFLKHVLEECDAEVITAQDASEAFECIHSQRPDLLLCDIGLPKVDGHDFLRRLHEHGFDMPAVAVTALGRPEDRQRSLQTGYQAYLVKPVEPATLLAAVADVREQLLKQRA